MSNLFSIIRKNMLASILFFTIFLMGIVFTFLVPPFQKPDENAHFFRAVALSKGGVFCQEGDDNKFFTFPKKYAVFANKMEWERIAMNYNQKFIKKNLLTIDSELENNNYQEIKKLEGFCFLNPIPYTIFVLPILISELFKSILFSLYFSRFAAFIVFFFAILWSYNKIKYSKLRWIVMLYAMIPMVVYQTSTVGYDYLQLAIAPMLFSLNINFILNKKSPRRDIYLFAILMVTLLFAKAGYYFLPLVYFLIPREKVARTKKQYYLFTIIYFLICLLPMVIASIGNLHNAGAGGPIDPVAQMELLKNPIYTFGLLQDTVSTYLGFYGKGFIGIFGWVDHEFKEYVYYIFSLFIIGSIYYISKIDMFKKFTREAFIILFLFLLNVIFIFLTFYLTWNEVGAEHILGIQGRYFLIFTPYLVLFLGWIVRLVRQNRILQIILLLLGMLILLYEIFVLTFDRYYGNYLDGPSVFNSSNSETSKEGRLVVGYRYL